MKFNILLSFTKAKKIKENNHDKLLREQYTCTLDNANSTTPTKGCHFFKDNRVGKEEVIQEN